MENFSYTTTNSPGILRKGASFLITAALIGLMLMFSVLIFMVVFTVGAMAWGYLWWKTRDLRKQMRNHPLGDEVIRGEVIEGEIINGEVIRVIDSSNNGER
ncbi:MAG: hypothetical protein Q7T21_04225 [Gallionella sp.]|nr:hypothetical protein [Gallionella sp.]